MIFHRQRPQFLSPDLSLSRHKSQRSENWTPAHLLQIGTASLGTLRKVASVTARREIQSSALGAAGIARKRQF